MTAVSQLAPTVGVAAACEVLGVPRASFYRQPVYGPAPARPTPPRALSQEERETVRDLLNSPRFVDCAPAAIQATLLDEGQYLCSTRTMYRILDQDGATRERRDQLTHPAYQKPELLATAPNQVWSWDITKLRGPVKWTYYYLYVILDVFSRYVVGWMIAPRESAELAKTLIEETCEKYSIPKDQLTIHADCGSSMRSKPVAFLLADLGITKTHSRPYTSNDNPYSESHFRTMKYRPDFPTASAAPRTATPSATVSSPGTTTTIATPALACSRPPGSTSARRPRSSSNAKPSSMPPTSPTRSASSANRPPPAAPRGGLDQSTNKLTRLAH